MRILLGTAWYFPESVGGTEMYVRGLASALAADGVDVAVAVPVGAACAASRSEVDDVPVFRFPGIVEPDGRLESQFTQAASAGWHDLLDAWRPTLVDLQALTSQMGLPHLREARAHGARTVVTIHQGGFICARGTFMRFGSTPCSGDLASEPCGACRLDARGVRPLIGGVAARWLGRGRAEVARRRYVSAITHEADRVVSVSRWLADALARNGVSLDKIRVCPQGVGEAPSRTPAGPRVSAALRVGYAGRIDPAKGLDVLIDAVIAADRRCSIELHIWGIARDGDARALADRLRGRANGHPQIVWHAETAERSDIYRAIDILAVPSVGLETGPLVVLEAQAAGLPVIGSDLGGIAERVRHGIDGVLVPAGDATAWTSALVRLATEPGACAALVPSSDVRTPADVARDTLRIYRELHEVRVA